MSMQELSEKDAGAILEKLDEMDQKIEQIRRDLDVMLQIHEMLHPEALERARAKVELEGEEEAACE